jgi:hypothetical protein
MSFSRTALYGFPARGTDPNCMISRALACVICRHVFCWNSTDASEEHFAFIFKVEEYVKQETSPKQALHGVICQRIGLFVSTAVRTSNPHNLKLLGSNPYAEGGGRLRSHVQYLLLIITVIRLFIHVFNPLKLTFF